jgi:hypothetical protein
MNENKIEKFLKPRYFFTLFIVILYILFGMWMVAENSNPYIVGINWTPLISVFLILINNRWSDRIVLFYYIFDFAKTFSYVIGRCRENFPTNTLQESYYWLIDMPSFRWTLAFWILQISLIVYLFAVEIKIYKNKKSLV